MYITTINLGNHAYLTFGLKYAIIRLILVPQSGPLTYPQLADAIQAKNVLKYIRSSVTQSVNF